MKEIESVRESGGYLNRYVHESASCGCEMTFSVYLPPAAKDRQVPALYWLSGLTGNAVYPTLVSKGNRRERGLGARICAVGLAEDLNRDLRDGAPVLAAALSAAVRNVLLYRSLVESIDEVAAARRDAQRDR